MYEVVFSIGVGILISAQFVIRALGEIAGELKRIRIEQENENKYRRRLEG